MHIGDEERRRRLVRRHRLGRTATGVDDAVEALAVSHSSDPITPFLAAWARFPGFAIADLERALWEDRSLWRMHTIRRTLFVVPTRDAPAFEAGAARDVARRERDRLEGWVAAERGMGDAGAWLAGLGAAVVEALGDGEMSTRELGEAVPDLATEVTVGSGKWSQRVSVGSRILLVLATEGHLVRTRPAGSWRSSQYRWSRVEPWFGRPLERLDEAEGRALVAARYLAAYGPVTTTDVRWWAGWTLAATRRALADVGAVAVELDSGEPGWVLPGDTADTDPLPGPAVALLPPLDSTPMGWKQRAWYLGPHQDHLFDTNGNAGPTVWAGGRIVGGWGQRRSGEVVHQLLETVPAGTATAVADEAAALTAWLDGEVAVPRFPTPLAGRLALG